MIDLVLSGTPGTASRAAAHPMLQQYLRILESASAEISTPITGQRIGVTSTHCRAGVSTLAANMAIAAAKLGRQQVTLLEVNRYRPSLQKNFAGVGKLGLTEVLAEKCEPEDAIYEATDAGLYLVPVGKQMWASKLAKFPEMAVHSAMAELAQDSDTLIVDLPIVGKKLTTAMSLLLDGVILLVQANKVTSTELAQVKRHYQICGVPILGTVFRRK